MKDLARHLAQTGFMRRPRRAPVEPTLPAPVIQARAQESLVIPDAEVSPERVRGRPRKGAKKRSTLVQCYVSTEERKRIEAYMRKYRFNSISDALREMISAGIQIVPEHCKP